MELIPVLSTIILVATITTFILAIGAYILYKRREKRGEQYTAFPERPLTGELITPSSAPGLRQREDVSSGKLQSEVLSERITLTGRPPAGQTFQVKSTKEKTRKTEEKRAEEKFMKYTDEGYKNAKDNDERGSLKWK